MNQGSSFTEQDIRRATEAFYRSDKSRTAYHKHLGMGLFIVEEIVQKHRGYLTLRNTNTGVCVQVSLPIQTEEIC